MSRQHLGWLLVIVTLSPVVSVAQLTGGSVVGTVKDRSGAVVPGANVVLTNTATGTAVRSVTSPEGIFTFSTLPVGLYQFGVSAQGFRTSTGSFTTELNKTRSLSVVLTVGSRTEQVEVQGAAAPVETSSTQLLGTFSRREVLDLPLASVNVNDLALLTPNVVDINTTGLNRAQVIQKVSSPVGGSIASVGGSRARNNSFIVDGVDNNDPINTGPQGSVIQDAVQEFSVVKNSFDAEFGQFSGGQFNIVTRTGTNRYHGNAFWYNQNKVLNATDYGIQQLIRSGEITDKPRYDYNRLGGTLGGPIKGDRLFFFGAYEFENLGAASSTNTAIFPTQLGTQILSSLPPGTTASGSPGRVSPFVLGFLKTFGAVASDPLPASDWPTVLGTPIPVGNVSRSFPSYAVSHRFLASSDWTPGIKDQVHFRFNYDHGPNQLLPGFPIAGLDAKQTTTNELFSATDVHTLSPTLLNELRISYHHQVTGDTFGSGVAAGLPNIIVAAGPLIGPNANAPSGSFDHIYQLGENLTWQRGRHIFKVGTDLRDYIIADRSRPAPRGDYEYSNFESFIIDSPPDVNGQRGLGSSELSLNYHSLNFYAQDHVRLKPTFTMYLGVRYEYNSLLHDLAAQQSESIANVPGVIAFSKPTVEKNNWAPRIGFAWDVFGSGTTAVRGGFGIAYAPIFGAFVGGGLLPSTVQQVFFTDCLPDCPIPVPSTNFLANGGIPNILAPFDTPDDARAAIATYVPNIKRPYLQTTTLEVEREISHSLVATARYLHTKGTHLSVQARLNAGVVPPPTSFLPTFFDPGSVPSQPILDTLPTLTDFESQVFFPFRQFGFSNLLTTHLPIGNSTYDAGSIEVSKRFASGFEFDANYTFSKFIDDSTNEFFNSFINPRRPQDWRNLRNERSRSVLDAPHRFVMQFVWDTPWYRTGSGFSRQVLGNWTLAGTYSASSGQPFTALSVANSEGNGDVTVQRTVLNPAGTSNIGSDVTSVTNSGGAVVGYLATDPSAKYVRAQEGTFPTAPRNSLRAPGINTADFMVSKYFGLGEERRLQFGTQFFNIFNHPQFTAANLLAVDQGLGLNYAFVLSPGFNDMKQAGGTGGARLIQLFLKLSF